MELPRTIKALSCFIKTGFFFLEKVFFNVTPKEDVTGVCVRVATSGHTPGQQDIGGKSRMDRKFCAESKITLSVM